MPTDDQLCCCGCIVVSICVFCFNSFDCTAHLFFDCPFARAIWLSLEDVIWIQLDFSSPIALIQCCSLSPVENILLAAFLHVLHTIWISRNAVIFNSTNVSVHSAIAKVKTTISISASLCKVRVWHGSPGASILGDLNISPNFKTPHLIKFVCWHPPTHPWLKVNTDGSLVGNVATCGGIFRNALSVYMGSFSSKLQVTLVLHAELLGIIIAIEQAHTRGWMYLWI